MSLRLSSRFYLRQLQLFRGLDLPSRLPLARTFHASARTQAVKPFLLADIGEGIRECEIIQWFVEPEARVEEWDKLCEVQSDKASVEITSRFAGVIKKLHYDAGEMAQVGKPLLDIDIQGEIKQDLTALTEPASVEESERQPKPPAEVTEDTKVPLRNLLSSESRPPPSGKHAALATPAVRHLTKELDIDIIQITGTGKDGRVLKEDVYQFAQQRDSAGQKIPIAATDTPVQQETITQLSNTQHQMFKTMTKSLAIPHFLYADEIDFSGLWDLRARLNARLSQSPHPELSKLSFLPFIIKAVSMSLTHHPTLNARVDLDPASAKPVLVMRSHHNIGVAMDTPSGLLVPVIKNVAHLTVLSIAQELTRLQSLAAAGKLTSRDLSGGTITVSNVGSIGGTYVSPVVVEREVAILGIGRMRTVPAFADDGRVVKRRVCNFSWSADHRVVDGATMARAAELVRGFVEDPDSMVMYLR